MITTLLILAALFMLGWLYIHPTLVAAKRHHPHREAIFYLNVLLGWTFVGWVAALVWAMVPVRGVRL